MSKQRIEWVDLAKGLAILLVIIGHTDFSLFRHLIYSFHMPFFFVMSGYTFHASSDKIGYWKHFWKGFRHLVLPAYALVTLTLFYQYLTADNLNSPREFISQSLQALLFFSGVPGNFIGHHIAGIGVAWFLVSFFLAKELYDYLQMRFKGSSLFIVVIILSLLGVGITKYTWLPLSFDISLATLIFFYVGVRLKKKELEKTVSYKPLFLNGAIWLGGGILLFIICHNSMALAVRRYILFPLCYIVAMFGTLTMMDFSVLVDKIRGVWRRILCPIYFAGECSLYVLYVHIMDFIWMPPLDGVISNTIILAVIRCVVDVALGLLLVKILSKQSLYIKQ